VSTSTRHLWRRGTDGNCEQQSAATDSAQPRACDRSDTQEPATGEQPGAGEVGARRSTGLTQPASKECAVAHPGTLPLAGHVHADGAPAHDGGVPDAQPEVL